MTTVEALVRRYYESIDENEYDAVFDLFADDVVYDRPGADDLEGIDAFREFYREQRPLSEGEHSLDDVVVDGDRVAVRGRYAGRQDGEDVSFGFADFFEFDAAGEISHRVTYTDRDAV